MQSSTGYLDQTCESTLQFLSTIQPCRKRKLSEEQNQLLTTKCQMLETSVHNLQKHLKSVRDHVATHPATLPMLPAPIRATIPSTPIKILQDHLSCSPQGRAEVELSSVLPLILTTLQNMKTKAQPISNSFLCKIGTLLDHAFDIISQVHSGKSAILLLPSIQQALHHYNMIKKEGLIRINYRNDNGRWRIVDATMIFRGESEKVVDPAMHSTLESWFGLPQHPLMLASTGVFMIHAYCLAPISEPFSLVQ